MGNVVQQQVNPRLAGNQRYHQMSTHDLYKTLEGECISTLHTIRSLQRGRRYDENGRVLICHVMRELENKIHNFNEDMFGPVSNQSRQAHTDEMQRLRKEIHILKKENERLSKTYKNAETLLTQSLNKRSGSYQAKQANSQDQTKQVSQNKDATGNTALQINDLKSKLICQDEEIINLKTKNESALTFIDLLKDQKEKLEINLKELQDEKQTLIRRLSKVGGEKLVDDNPAIADLSDPNRPTKLGEFYSEMYDNEWTDAFEALTNSGYDDKEAIITLRLTLINVLKFCKSKSSNLLQKTEEAVNFLFEEYKDFKEKAEKWLKQAKDCSFDGIRSDSVHLQDRWKPKIDNPEQAEEKESVTEKKSDVIVQKLKIFRKDVAESMVPMVQKAYISASWKNEYVLELKPYIKKCIFLGWMMVVQSPPMCLLTCKEGGSFDKNIFKEYQKSGPYIDYVVWPALYLHDNGPLVGKGVAEGKK